MTPHALALYQRSCLEQRHGPAVARAGLKIPLTREPRFLDTHPIRILCSLKVTVLARQYAIKYEKDPSWKFNLTCPGKVSSNLTRYEAGSLPVETGAVNSVRLATLGPDGETGIFSSAEGGKIPW